MEGKNKHNKLGKIKNLLKKEAFYVVLFICICVVGTSVAIASKISSNKEEQQQLAEKSESVDISTNENQASTNMENAEQVKNDSPKEKAQTTNNNSKAVSNTTQNVEFKEPLKGEVARKYNDKVVRIDSETSRNINGIDIKSAVGTEVKASAEGVIEEVGSTAELGTYVAIKHSNGYKSYYGNLDKSVSVKKGSKVKVGDSIGKIGSTCTIVPMNQEGTFLRFVIKDSKNKNIDPLTYKSITLK